jgi:hypothetical protein
MNPSKGLIHLPRAYRRRNCVGTSPDANFNHCSADYAKRAGRRSGARPFCVRFTAIFSENTSPNPPEGFVQARRYTVHAQLCRPSTSPV